MELPEGGDPDRTPSGGKKSLRGAGLLFGAGIQLAVSVAVMFFIGRWADEKFHTAPWLLITGVMFGVGAGLYNFIKTAIEAGENGKGETGA